MKFLDSNTVEISPLENPEVDPDVQEAAGSKAQEFLKNNFPVPDEMAKNVRSIELVNSSFNKCGLLGDVIWLQKLDLDST